MTQSEINDFKEKLFELRKEVNRRIKSTKEDDRDTSIKEMTGELSSYTHHMADQGSDSLDQDNHFRDMEREGDFLYEIDEALARIDENRYGICETCRSTIHSKRLKYMPYARLCLQCQQIEETTQREWECEWEREY
jgi:DnaK suppressor protein